MADPDAGIPFRKGHGTENDFVLLPDPDGALELTEARVRALCDRRRGLGADGVLRVVRAVSLGEPIGQACARAGAEWFMDYRNADGSVAEMCGNGVRVFARYLADAGLVSGADMSVGTRGGVKAVTFRADGDITVGMGQVRVGGHREVALGGRMFTGLAVDVGNPHLACVINEDLATLNLCEAPVYDEVMFPRGVNVEFLSAPADGEIQMRVYERGVGETRSCGTGTVAAAAAALRFDGRNAGALAVRVPGGRVRVELTGGEATLTGPAVVLAVGELSARWWRSSA